MENEEYLLMQRIAAGDEDAFGELARRFADDLTHFCRSRTRNADSAHDLRQEVLIKVWRGAGAFDGRSTLRTWLYRVVAHAAIDEHRRLERVPVPAEMLADSPAGEVALEDRVVGSAHLRWALDQVPEPFRAAIILSDLCDLPDLEVARACGIAPATVRTRLHRGRAALRELLSHVTDQPQAA